MKLRENMHLDRQTVAHKRGDQIIMQGEQAKQECIQ
jgi:hypothetical protein